MNWSIPDWRNITQERFEAMSSDEATDFLMKVYRSAKDVLPDGPEKAIILRIGRLCIEAHDLKQKYENGQEDGEKVKKKLESNLAESISLMHKLIILHEAEKINKEVEVESEKYEDPWGDDWKEKPKLIPSIREEEKGDTYDPWKDVE